MLKRTERILFRISSVLSKVEPEPDLHTGLLNLLVQEIKSSYTVVPFSRYLTTKVVQTLYLVKVHLCRCRIYPLCRFYCFIFQEGLYQSSFQGFIYIFFYLHILTKIFRDCFCPLKLFELDKFLLSVFHHFANISNPRIARQKKNIRVHRRFLCGFFPVLRSRNYLFSAPAPAPAIHSHFKLF